MEVSGISVVVLGSARAVSIRAQVELATVVKERPEALVSFAVGGTFRQFFHDLAIEVAQGRLDLSSIRATHLDEFKDFTIESRGGFAHALLQCAPLRQAFDDGRFFPVPAAGSRAELATALAAHESRLAGMGGIALQFVGIGGNGRIAFSEPGTDPGLGFHIAKLATSTRAALESCFAPDPVPTEAATAGPASVLEAERVVLVATGAGKAKAVRDMLEGEVMSSCPASVIRRHPDALVLLDRAAAASLDWPELESAAS